MSVTSEKDNGGPAFPTTAGQVVYSHGMTLRTYAAIKLRVPESGIDWLDEMIRQAKCDDFAGQALAGWLASFGPDDALKAIKVAETAYGVADARLEARK